MLKCFYCVIGCFAWYIKLPLSVYTVYFTKNATGLAFKKKKKLLIKILGNIKRRKHWNVVSRG